MNWRNVRLIYGREIRDQLRDRRTLFMIAVLPLLLVSAVGDERVSAFAVFAEERAEGAGDRQRAVGGRARTCRRCSTTGISRPSLFDDPADGGAAATWSLSTAARSARARSLGRGGTAAEDGRGAGGAAVSAGLRRAAARAARSDRSSGRNGTRRTSEAAARGADRDSRAADCCTTRARRSRASPTCRWSMRSTPGSRRSSARICWPAACRRTWPGRLS